MGQPQDDIIEKAESVVLRCAVDANPPASVIWRKEGKQDIFSFEETLEFRPVMRGHSGKYFCEAQNKLGGSLQQSVILNVMCKSSNFN